MRMRPVVFGIIASIAWIAWFASAMVVERHRETDPAFRGAAFVLGDYPLCVTVRPPPLQPPRKVVLHPGNSELS